MRKIVGASAALLLATLAVWATDAALLTPIGRWKTIDDKTGKPKAIVQVYLENGKLYGKIEATLDPNAKKVCDKCKDERKGQPIVGMVIMRGLVHARAKNIAVAIYWTPTTDRFIAAKCACRTTAISSRCAALSGSRYWAARRSGHASPKRTNVQQVARGCVACHPPHGRAAGNGTSVALDDAKFTVVW